MATSSITETVFIKDRKRISQFVKALESSKESKSKPVTYSRPVEHVNDKDDIRRIFKGTDGNDGI